VSLQQVPHHSPRKIKSTIFFSLASPHHHACPLADSLRRCPHMGLVHQDKSYPSSRASLPVDQVLDNVLKTVLPSDALSDKRVASLVYRSWHCVESVKCTSASIRLSDHHCVALWDAAGLSFVKHSCCLTHPPRRPPPRCLGQARASSSSPRIARKGSSSQSGEVREYRGKEVLTPSPFFPCLDSEFTGDDYKSIFSLFFACGRGYWLS
jgi:hypothetical protein